VTGRGGPDGGDVFARAQAHHQAGRLGEAEKLYRRVIDREPSHLGALYHLSLLAGQSGRAQLAVAMGRRAAAAAPANPAVHNNLGVALMELGRADESAAAFRTALALAPGTAAIHYNSGRALKALGRPDEAAAAFRAAIRLRPDHANAHDALGTLLAGLDRPEEAIGAFRAAVALEPGRAEFHCNLGNALAKTHRPGQAEATLRRALELSPDLAEAHSSLAYALVGLGRLDEAAAECRRAAALAPDSATFHDYLGNVFRQMLLTDDALAAYRRAVSLDPAFDDAHHDLAGLLLLRGDYAEGWEEHEWRFKSEVPHRPFPQPRWRGEDLAGRRLLVWGEQGIGDELAFFAILPELVAGGADVVVECDPRLVPLLARSLPQVEAAVRTDPPDARLLADDIDVQAPVVSAVALLRPSRSGFRPLPPYLTADAAVTADLRRDYGPGPLVGISWWTRHPKLERSFSIPLADWRPILDVPGFRFVSLQYGAGRAEIAAAGFDLIDDITVDPLTDLDRFAAQVAAMDLVISIDNSTVSMACVLGRPVWDLLAFVPDWRMGASGADSPWHPTLRLFRQPAPGAWAPVVAEVAADLRRFVAPT